MSLDQITERLNTQDNRCTSDPIFIVQQKKRIWGVSTDYAGDYAWLDFGNEHEEADLQLAEELDDLEFEGCETGSWQKVGYVDIWEFVTACFTEAACQEYIDRNRHNLNEPRIYAASAYRNREFIDVRNYLLGRKP